MTSVGTYVEASGMAMLQMAVFCILGILLGHFPRPNGLLSPATMKILSKFTTVVFFPPFIIYGLGNGLSQSIFVDSSALIVWGAIHMAVNFALTVTVGRFFGKVPAFFAVAFVFAMWFQNSAALPLLLIRPVARVVVRETESLEDEEEAFELAKVGVFLYTLPWHLCFWGIALPWAQTLAEWEKGVKGEANGISNSSDSGQAQSSGKCWTILRRALLAPAIISVAIGLVVGLVPAIKGVLIDDDGELWAVGEVLRQVGDMTIPASNLVMGGSLYHGLVQLVRRCRERGWGDKSKNEDEDESATDDEGLESSARDPPYSFALEMPETTGGSPGAPQPEARPPLWAHTYGETNDGRRVRSRSRTFSEQEGDWIPSSPPVRNASKESESDGTGVNGVKDTTTPLAVGEGSQDGSQRRGSSDANGHCIPPDGETDNKPGATLTEDTAPNKSDMRPPINLSDGKVRSRAPSLAAISENGETMTGGDAGAPSSTAAANASSTSRFRPSLLVSRSDAEYSLQEGSTVESEPDYLWGVPWQTVVTMLVLRLLLSPLLGFLMLWGLEQADASWIATGAMGDPMRRLLVLMESAMPSAQLVLVACQQLEMKRAAEAVAVVLVLMYLASLVTVTAAMTVAMRIVLG